jgi:hypothetical protein
MTLMAFAPEEVSRVRQHVKNRPLAFALRQEILE